MCSVKMYRIALKSLEHLLREDIERNNLGFALSELGVDVMPLESDLVGDLVLSILGFPEDNTVQFKSDYANKNCYCRDPLNNKINSTRPTPEAVSKLFDWLLKDLAKLRKQRPNLFPAG
jgi:hypothetical protein